MTRGRVLYTQPDHTTTSPDPRGTSPRQPVGSVGDLRRAGSSAPRPRSTERRAHARPDRGPRPLQKFGKVEALSGLTLTLPAGKAVAVLGPNGAGKTTFIRMVATLIPSRPRDVDGQRPRSSCTDPMAVRRMIGHAGQSAAVEEMMTGRENLMMVARLYGQRRSEAVASSGRILEQMDLVDAADRSVERRTSAGIRRRLDLGAGLVGSPRLLLLDEPTTGTRPGKPQRGVGRRPPR